MEDDYFSFGQQPKAVEDTQRWWLFLCIYMHIPYPMQADAVFDEEIK